MRLEQQLARLAEIGLELNDGITINDLLYSFNREDYERRPFDLVLFVLGIEVEREPWGRWMCSRVWNFDTECIATTGDYTQIVKRLCEISGQPNYLKDVSDCVDFDTGEAWLKYKVNDTQRNWLVEVDDDWADALTLSYVMDDIQRNDHRFYLKDNGQAMILFYLDQATAAALNKLTNNALQFVIPE
jgi:hypothetical protein